MAKRSSASIDVEAAAIKAQLELLERREEEFEKLLRDMEGLKESVSTEKRTLVTKALELEVERHPIHWLPPEWLAQIFLILVNGMKSNDGGLPVDAPTGHHHPSVTISHVFLHTMVPSGRKTCAQRLSTVLAMLLFTSCIVRVQAPPLLTNTTMFHCCSKIWTIIWNGYSPSFYSAEMFERLNEQCVY
jgi:hypothetical protein